MIVSTLLMAGLTLVSPTPRLYVSGRFLCDPGGRKVNLHGYMQPGESWFNGEGRNFPNPKDYTDPASVAPALAYYEAVSDILSDRSPRDNVPGGWCCTFVRYICDGNGVSNFAPGWDAAGELSKPEQFQGWMSNLLVPYVRHCRSKGLYVVLLGNPSETFPLGKDGKPDTTRNMSRQYQKNLIRFWTAVASNPAIRSAENVQFEICNEPIAIESSFGSNDWRSGNDASERAITNFMQPVVDAIRATGAENVVWVPGLGWQGEAAGWAKYPIRGRNVGYAVHFYPAYGGVKDDPAAVRRLWESNYKPAADVAPMIITEMFWNPNKGVGYEGLWNAHTAGFGNAVKGCIDDQGNVSFVVGMVGDLFANLKDGLAKATPSMTEGARAVRDWFPKYPR
jgi:hypothetical protein